MPCDTQRLLEEEKRRREEALAELQRQIQQGKIILEKQPNGQVKIRNWGQTTASKVGWHESCVLATILRRGTWLAKQKLTALLQAQGVTAAQVIAAHDHEH